MARRDFSVRDLVEIYLHWQAGESLRGISKNLGVDRNTVRKYVRAAEESGIKPGEHRSESEWADFIRRTFPAAGGDQVARASRLEELVPFDARIREGLKHNHASTVWQRLRDEEGLSVSLSTFRRYIRATMADVVDVDRVTVWRPEVPPGEEVQIDYGRLGPWNEPGTQKRRSMWAFIMVLSFSRHMYVRPVLKMDQSTWLECHLLGFSFFRGVTRRLVLDNLRSGVLKSDLYDPKFNRSYAELASYHGALIDPCRVGKSKDKAKVERMVPYVRDSYWRGREFPSLKAAAAEAERWCLEVAGQRIHGTTRHKPLEIFENEELKALLPLPADPWEMVRWAKAKVAPDSHVQVAGVLYSVPYRYLGLQLDVRLTDSMVQLFRGSELVKTHVRVARGRQTDVDDLPPDKIAFYHRNPQWCLHQATRLGEEVYLVVEALLSVRTLYNLRQAQGVIRCGERFGHLRLNAACTRALAFGDPSYRTVKNILERGLDRQLMLPLEIPSETPPAFLRGPQQFREEVSH